MEVTSLDELKEIANGKVYELPGFTDNTTFKVRIKQYGLLGLMTSGKVPNKLLSKADELFDIAQKHNEGTRKLSKKEEKEVIELEDILLTQAMVEPTYKDIKQLGLELNVIQKALIIEISQGEVSGLETFREHRERIEDNNNIEGI